MTYIREILRCPTCQADYYSQWPNPVLYNDPAHDPDAIQCDSCDDTLAHRGFNFLLPLPEITERKLTTQGEALYTEMLWAEGQE